MRGVWTFGVQIEVLRLRAGPDWILARRVVNNRRLMKRDEMK